MTLRRLALMSVPAAGLAAPAGAQAHTIICNSDAPHCGGVRTTASATGETLVSDQRIKSVRAHQVHGSLTYKGLDYTP